MTHLRKLGLSVIFSALASSSAFAYITGPLPSSTYITDNGLNWTWASPWGTFSEGTRFAAPSAHDGWRYATVTELQYLYANLVDDFLNAGDPIQSVAYWDLDGSNNHVDTGDLNGGYIMSGGNYFEDVCNGQPCEVFYVQDGNRVPLPGTLALLGVGGLALGLTRRKKKTA